jgi:hypothetical protein
MEVTVSLTLNKEELWLLIESLPANPQGVKKSLSDKLTAARVPFERKHQVYGNGSKIQPKEVV